MLKTQPNQIYAHLRLTLREQALTPWKKYAGLCYESREAGEWYLT